MPDITAYSDVFRNWESLIGACEFNAARLPGAEDLLAALKTSLEMAKTLKLEQENLTAQRKVKTQLLVQAVVDGRKAVRKLRFMVEIRLGSDSELLTQFGISPIRSRLRKARVTDPTAPGAGTTEPQPPEAPEGNASTPLAATVNQQPATGPAK